jgi:hypothetical protein
MHLSRTLLLQQQGKLDISVVGLPSRSKTKSLPHSNYYRAPKKRADLHVYIPLQETLGNAKQGSDAIHVRTPIVLHIISIQEYNR